MQLRWKALTYKADNLGEDILQRFAESIWLEFRIDTLEMMRLDKTWQDHISTIFVQFLKSLQYAVIQMMTWYADGDLLIYGEYGILPVICI